MQPEYTQVRAALIAKGFADRPMADRGDIMCTLQVIRQEDSRNEEFVDEMRELMEVGGKREDRSETLRLFMLEKGVKGCRQCGKKPAIVLNESPGILVKIRCEFCRGSGVRAVDFPTALVDWNNPDDCPDSEEIENRQLYPMPMQFHGMRFEIITQDAAQLKKVYGLRVETITQAADDFSKIGDLGD